MDTNQHQTTKEKAVDKKHEEGKLKQESAAKQQSSTTPASPASASSSPSHEFSFTISLHSSSTTTVSDKNKSPSSFAIDLSPADDIFFHGHLLPLHLLSHLPVPPRSSTNSLDSFTVPIRDLIDDQNSEKSFSNCSPGNNSNTNSSNNIKNSNNKSNHQQQSSDNDQTKGRSKSKSFLLFRFTRWRKGYEVREDEDNINKVKGKQKMRFDVSHVIKRYMRMVRPLLFFRGRRENLHFRRQPYSFSTNLSFRNKKELRGRSGEFSAPASIRTSPTNSGLLVATAATLPSSTSDSTMEELQAAIQAAIAHCKNSIAVEEKLKC